MQINRGRWAIQGGGTAWPFHPQAQGLAACPPLGALRGPLGLCTLRCGVALRPERAQQRLVPRPLGQRARTAGLGWNQTKRRGLCLHTAGAAECPAKQRPQRARPGAPCCWSAPAARGAARPCAWRSSGTRCPPPPAAHPARDTGVHARSVNLHCRVGQPDQGAACRLM